MDELSPLFEDVEFHERFRGYDQDEVDAYIDRLANAAATMQGRMTELQIRVEAAEARAGGGLIDDGAGHEAEETLTRTLVLAQRTADAAIAEAREEADRLTSEAGREADATLVGARAEAQVTLRETQAEAAAILREAEEQAAALVADAEERQRRLVADAESMAAEAASAEQERLAREVGELQDLRAFLADDVEILERHLEEQRRQLGVSLSAINELIESPETFRTSRAPATSGAEVDPGLLAVTPLEASAQIDVDEYLDDPAPEDERAGSGAAEAEVVTEDVDEEADDEEIVDEEIVDEPVEAVGEVPSLISQYPAPTPFDQEGTLTGESDDVTEADGSDASWMPGDEDLFEETSDDHAEDEADRTVAADFLRSREEFESVDDPPSELVDLTGAAPSGSAIDLESGEEPASAIDLESGEEPGSAIDLESGDEPASAIDLESGDESTAEPGIGGGSGPASVPPRLVTAADLDASGAVATAPVDDLDAGGPATAQIPLVEEASLFAETTTAAEDPFLAQLRDAVAAGEAELEDDDALSAFFDQGPEEEGRSWFGRRR